MNIKKLIQDNLPKGLKVLSLHDLSTNTTTYTMSKTIRLSDLYSGIEAKVPAKNNMSLVKKTRIPNIKTLLQIVCPDDWQNYFDKGSTRCKMAEWEKENVRKIYNTILRSKHNLKKPYIFLYKEEDFTTKVNLFFASLTSEDFSKEHGFLTYAGDEKMKAFLKGIARKMHVDLFEVKEKLDKKYLRELVRAKRIEKAENSYQ